MGAKRGRIDRAKPEMGVVPSSGLPEVAGGPSRPDPAWHTVVLVTLISLAIGAISAYLIVDYRNQQYDRASDLLTRTAKDDATEVERWLDGGFVDAAVMASQAGVAERYLRWQQGLDTAFPQMLSERLTAEKELRGYDCITMFTPTEWPYASTSGGRCADSQFKCADFASTVVSAPDPGFEDHFHNAVGAWCVAWSSPVRLNATAPVLGVIVYSVQMRDPLVDILGDEPLPYESSEIALVGRHDEGFDVISSAIGFESVTLKTGPELHVQLAEDLAAEDSVFRMGRDEEGRAVMAAARRVDGTEWFVASRVDVAEVNGPIIRYGVLIGFAWLLAVLALALGAGIVRRARWERYREHLALMEIKEALDARDRFMRNMSHELRTPLQSIMGFTSIILGGMAGPITDEQRRQLGMVDASSKRLLALVDDVLDLGRMREHGVRVHAGRFTSSDVTTALVEAMRPLSERKSLECRLGQDGGPIEMETDRAMVERILLNLLSNAIKYTDAGFVRLHVRPDGDGHVVFEVSDSGRGIPESEIDRVMEDFHQVLEPDGAKPVGTGLGLPISRRMAEALGGELTVTSVLGEGSTFRLRIPRVHAEARKD